MFLLSEYEGYDPEKHYIHVTEDNVVQAIEDIPFTPISNLADVGDLKLKEGNYINLETKNAQDEIKHIQGRFIKYEFGRMHIIQEVSPTVKTLVMIKDEQILSIKMNLKVRPDF